MTSSGGGKPDSRDALSRIKQVRNAIERLAHSREIASHREFEFTDADFAAIRELAATRAGIALGDGKRDMVYVRLSRRLRELGLRRFSDYLALLGHDTKEFEAFINALTTNLTYFFREPHHFEHLRGWLVRHRQARIWSAGCATGEEVWSIAITACEAWSRLDPPVEIIGTDIDTQVLEAARLGIYPGDRLDQLPPGYRERYFLPLDAGRWQVRPELRALAGFRRLNLAGVDWSIHGPLDAIFCRNVLIYFSRETQESVIGRFVPLLRPGGFLYLGHSENLLHATGAFVPLGRTIYRRREDTGMAAGRPAIRPGGDPPPNEGEKASRSVALMSTGMSSDRQFHETGVRRGKNNDAIHAGDPVILIGASTGGTEAIRTVLQELPADFPPVLIVQHMPEHFTAPFARRLDQVCALRVGEARDGIPLCRGDAWVAPGHSHLRVERQGNGYVLRLDRSDPVNRHRPSVDVLFFSAAEVLGPAAVAVLLTGMGRDGAQGLLALKEAGAHTIAQDEASAVIWGMPGEAVRLGAAREVLPLNEIAPAILQAVSRRQVLWPRS